MKRRIVLAIAVLTADFPGVTASSPSDVWIGWSTGVSTTTAMRWNG